MGQCVLRDLGFELEEKGQKKEMLDTYLKEKLRAKYPDAINIQKQKSDISDQGSQGLSHPKKRTTQSLYQADIEMTDGRLSRPFKNKKTKETVVQTENKDENVETVRAKSFMTLPTFSSEHPSANKTPRRVEDNASVQSFEGQEIRYKENNRENGIKLGTSQHPRSISPHTSGRIDLFMGSTPLRMKSENTLGVSGFRPSANAVENNMFKGIEKINLKEPAKPIEIKGFKNKYFQPVGHRTPSPKDGQHDKFLDDDEDFPYDDYQ